MRTVEATTLGSPCLIHNNIWVVCVVIYMRLRLCVCLIAQSNGKPYLELIELIVEFPLRWLSVDSKLPSKCASNVAVSSKNVLKLEKKNYCNSLNRILFSKQATVIEMSGSNLTACGSEALLFVCLLYLDGVVLPRTCMEFLLCVCVLKGVFVCSHAN